MEDYYADWFWYAPNWDSPCFVSALEQARLEGRCSMNELDAVTYCYNYTVKWCRENLKGEWTLESTYAVYFIIKDASDAAKFRLANL